MTEQPCSCGCTRIVRRVPTRSGRLHLVVDERIARHLAHSRFVVPCGACSVWVRWGGGL